MFLRCALCSFYLSRLHISLYLCHSSYLFNELTLAHSKLETWEHNLCSYSFSHIILGTECLEGTRHLFFSLSSAATNSGLHFSGSLSPKLEIQKWGDQTFQFMTPPQVTADKKFPSGHNVQMLVTPLASCFQCWEIWYQLDSCSFVISLPFSLEAVIDAPNFHQNAF